MSDTVDLRLPHQLGLDAAKRRLDQGIEQALASSLTQQASVDRRWDGDTLHFTVRAMGQAATGTAAVTDDAIALSIKLPWLLARLAEKVRPTVERETRKLLERK